MKRILRTVAALAAATLLAGSLAACDEKDPAAAPVASQSEAAPEESEAPQEVEQTGAPLSEEEIAELKERAAQMLAEFKENQTWNGEGEDPATMEDSEWNGEGEDPATMEDSDPQHDPDAVVVGYETLPGDCANDVPVALTGIRGGVVATENMGDGECLVVVSSQGDSLMLADLITQEFGDLGFTQTSKSQPDQGESAVNTLSYLTNTHEVHVTVSQDGASGSMIVYALTSSSRGNG